jgi:acyl-CoA thioester hydrolase
MLRGFGFTHPVLLGATGIAFVVRHLSADFRRPARLDDLLGVETRVAAQHGASLDLDQRIIGNAVDLVRIKLKLACIRADGRPARVPDDLHRVFGRLIANRSGPVDG